MILSLLPAILSAFIACGEERELVVRLETEGKLTAVQLFSFHAAQPAFSREYIQKLESVLRFDLNHNAATIVVEKSAFFQVKAEVNHRFLTVCLSSNDGETEAVWENLYLSGYLEQDRRVIHEAADAIHRELFGCSGIAATRLLYTVRTIEEGKENSEVWQADYDGENALQITPRSAGYCITPGYVPPVPERQAEQFFYVSYHTGIPKIYLAKIGGQTGQKMVALSGNQLMPAMNRQRDTIAFISDAAGNPDLFIQSFSPAKGGIGKPRHLYTARYAAQGSPTFSPDGSRIAFVSNKGGSPRIYLMIIPPAGTPLKEIQPVMISKINRENTAPCWSPDGTKIAYCAKTKGVRQIWIYDLLTGVERQLTQGSQNKENPAWAPNSLHLVYNTSDAGNCQLYLINIRQSKAVKITSGAGEKRFPCWEPKSEL